MARIGLLGGTFDPIHNAHINIAKEAYEQLYLDEIWFIPVLNNPFEKKIVATNEQRVKMIELASKDYSYMKICDIELKKDPNVKSYTYDTLKELNEIYDHEFYFIIGYDQAKLFDHWYQAKEITKLAKLVVFSRSGYEYPKESIPKYEMMEIQVKPMSTSSSSIRNGDLKDLNQDVLHYMIMNSIYTPSIIASRMSNKRYTHSISVAKTARMFAKNNGLDENKAYIAGLLHDIAKEMPEDKMRTIMEKHYASHLEASIPVWHQWISSYVCQNELTIDDPEILQAIENHTTAALNMTKLDMCLYCADKYEPTRGFDSSKEIAMCNENIVEGFKYSLKDFYDFSIKKGRSIDPIFFEVYKKFVEEDYCG